MKNISNLGFVVLLLAVVGCSCPKLNELAKQGNILTPDSTPYSANTSSNPTNSSPTAGDKTIGLSLDKFNKIQNGMSYREVVEIVGSEGTQTMSSGEGKYKVDSYKWEAENYKFLSVIFMGDKVNSKVQNGLK